MEASESFCLRWNDFESSYTETFRDLRQDSKFSDVTLVTPDSGNKAVQAHRVILSACSNFFKHMLCKQSQVLFSPECSFKIGEKPAKFSKCVRVVLSVSV